MEFIGVIEAVLKPDPRTNCTLYAFLMDYIKDVEETDELVLEDELQRARLHFTEKDSNLKVSLEETTENFFLQYF